MSSPSSGPGPAPDDRLAAWYSATAPLAPACIVEAGLHLGRRDGAPYLHGHGIWAGPDGSREAGHTLTSGTRLAVPAVVEATLIEGARLETADDAETGFPLFRPVPTRTIPVPDAVLATVRPNEDVHAALERIADAAGHARARVFGIGSLVGTRFADGSELKSYAAEILLTDGRIEGSRATLDAISVGFDGRHRAGRLARGNTVCVTFEALLRAD